MIIDILIINTVIWSFFLGIRKKNKVFIYKTLFIFIALLAAINLHENVDIFSQKVIVSNLMEKDYIIPVVEENKRDYLLTKALVEELPVTTEIQNKVIEHYYYENIDYVADELLNVSGEVVTKAMEILLIFVLVLVFLNVAGVIITKAEKEKRLTMVIGLNCLVNIIGNIIIISVILVLINLVGSFYILDLPNIRLEGSIFRPLIHKTVDIIIRFL